VCVYVNISYILYQYDYISNVAVGGPHTVDVGVSIYATYSNMQYIHIGYRHNRYRCETLRATGTKVTNCYAVHKN